MLKGLASNQGKIKQSIKDGDNQRKWKIENRKITFTDGKRQINVCNKQKDHDNMQRQIIRKIQHNETYINNAAKKVCESTLGLLEMIKKKLIK